MGSRPSTFPLTTSGRLRLFSTTELLSLPAPTWMIDPIMPQGGLVGLYGPPGSFKSFVAIDWALSVATGYLWQGLPTERGYVLYIAAEGGTGIGQRALSWLTERGISPAEANNVAWLTEAIPVYAESEDMDILLERVNEEVKIQPGLVIVDTLARCFDGDENTQLDMGRFVRGIDRMRQEFQATVIVVHHTRLDGDRERGNTALRGAADTMIATHRSGKSDKFTLECTKQKDAIEFETLALRMQQVEGTSSAVVGKRALDKSIQRQAQMLAILQDAGNLKADDWFSLTEPLKIPRSTFFYDIARLAKTGVISKKKGVWGVNSLT